MTAVYLMFGVALVGALYWLLIRLTNRQRQLQADLARLEQLAAEVTLHAEGIFDQVDARLASMARMAGDLETRLHAAPAAAAAEAEAETEAEAEAETEAPPEVTSLTRYQALRPRVWALADQGKTGEEIARDLGLPRGEVQLLLSLRARQITA